MIVLAKLLRLVFAAMFAALTAGVLMLAGAYLYLAPRLPSIESLKDVRLQVPLRVYARHGELIAEFGEKRRTPVALEDVPERLVQAFLAAEDDRFYEHPGVDYQGLLRAAFSLLRTGEKRQGGSTITMQVARNFFLSREKTFLRKLNEIFLALRIERELPKDKILELYLNKIYLGHRAYGVAAAAQVYYGKRIGDLDLAQMAMIAGLPKAPSRFNPIVNPERALARRNYVLGRMRELGFISEEEYRAAREAPATARLHAQSLEVEASYLAEMVRAYMVEYYGPDAYTAGYRVITTVDARLQRVANRALRAALMEYDRRHGYRGPEKRLDLEAATEPAQWDEALAEHPPVGGLRPALVLQVEARSARLYLGEGQEITLDWPALSWARPYVDDSHTGPAPATAGEILQPGDIVRVQAEAAGGWRLAQVPAVAGALVALAPGDGAIAALVGGFDFRQSKFNRATQALRQAGSSFKPFIYSAALEKGYTAATLINDAPVVFEDAALEATWRPENYSGRFYGPTRLREALVHSRNLVSIRLLRAIGVGYAIDYITRRFGFPRERLPRDLSLALGSGTVTPLEMAAAYAVFANGGFRVQPYFIERIEGPDGEILYQAVPRAACPDCEDTAPAPAERGEHAVARDSAGDGGVVTGGGPGAVDVAQAANRVTPAPGVLTPQNAYLMTSMMRDVIRRGTGRAARRLGRRDLAGKTGTTNDQRDAWFCGFHPELVAVTWVGFDQVRSLGERETGARAALPMWIRFMGEALRGVAEHPLEQPEGLVTVRIDPDTGLLAGAGQANAVFETFRVDHVPRRANQGDGSELHGMGQDGAPEEQLF